MDDAIDGALVAEIERRLDRLDRVFDLSRLHGAGATPALIRRYYELSRIGYRRVHSDQGAMHMALNPDGVFDRAGYAAQARLVQARLADDDRDILELACGNGYNLRLLAAGSDRPRDFLGIDLVPAQVRRANAALASMPHARAARGDFQRLELGDASQDVVYVIESFCHATDLPRAFSEVHRVLRPGGRFVVVDAWRTQAYAAAPEVVRRAAQYVELAMAVASACTLSSWQAAGERAGLRIVEDVDLTQQVKPNLLRLARVAERFVRRPRFVRLARLAVPDALLMNAVAGSLMGLTVEAGIHSYRLITLQRPA